MRALTGLVLSAAAAGCGARPMSAAPSPTRPAPSHASTAEVRGERPPNACFAPTTNGGAVATTRVSGETTGVACCAYLRTSGTRASRVAYVQSGTGIYSTADGDVGGLAPHALAAPSFALLTIDKPGIGMDERRRLTLDREAYRRHTLADLVACSKNAIVWAAARREVAAGARFVLYGHSEGAQSIVRLLDDKEPLLDRVELAVLSGMPMEPMLKATLRQLAIFLPFEIEPFEKALERRDDGYLVDLGLPARYLEHPTAREGLDGALVELAQRRPGLRVEVFHGERDLNAPIALVKSFAQRNERAKTNGGASLDLRLHLYPRARHDLDAWASADLAALVASLPPR